jgi:DNA-binding response OmpR family regulator
MKIFLLDYTNSIESINTTFTNNIEEFYENFLDKQYDILIVNLDFYSDVKEFVNIYQGYIIFLCDYSDELVYKKSLEIADFCYSYSEIYKLKYRIEYLKRKIYKIKSSIFKYKNLLYNFNTKNLYKDSSIIKITKAQQEIIELLIKNRNNFLDSDDIINISSFIGTKGSIKVIISSLRKLGFDIISKQNQGYKLNLKD